MNSLAPHLEPSTASSSSSLTKPPQRPKSDLLQAVSVIQERVQEDSERRSRSVSRSVGLSSPHLVASVGSESTFVSHSETSRAPWLPYEDPWMSRKHPRVRGVSVCFMRDTPYCQVSTDKIGPLEKLGKKTKLTKPDLLKINAFKNRQCTTRTTVMR